MQLTRNSESRFPTWEDLSLHAKAPGVDPAFVQAVSRLKGAPPNWRYRFARFVVTNMLKDQCYQKFLTCTWPEVIELMADQVVRNKALISSELNPSMISGSAPLSDRAGSSFSRPYGQMPCTRATAVRRVEKAQSLITFDDPVLLLGDDDLVSVELALAGFKNVTAVDIDDTVLTEIERAAKDSGVNVQLRQHDLAKTPPASLYQDYRLVLMDPPYSVEGVKLFMGGALELTRRRPGTLYFLSVHLMSLLRNGLPSLKALFDEYDLEICEFQQGFNAYPVPARLKSLIHLVNQILIGSKALTTEGYAFPFLLSDAIVLRKL